jgi:hypothetical protein
MKEKKTRRAKKLIRFVYINEIIKLIQLWYLDNTYNTGLYKMFCRWKADTQYKNTDLNFNWIFLISVANWKTKIQMRFITSLICFWTSPKSSRKKRRRIEDTLLIGLTWQASDYTRWYLDVNNNIIWFL